MKKKKQKRVHPQRRNGLFNPDAPFWRGERAEDLVKARVKSYTQKKPRKPKK